MSILREGAKKPVRLYFPTQKDARACRFKIYACRAKLRREHHPLAIISDSIVVSTPVLEPDNLWWITVEPTGFELEAQLIQLGILDPSDPFLLEARTEYAEAVSASDAVLDEYLKKTP